MFKKKASEFVSRVGAGRINEWSRLVGITASTQILLQVIGFVSGIIVIRLLPTSEYALYTLVNTMLGTMVVLADSGVASGVMAEGGKVYQDPAKLGSVMRTGLNLRKKFAIFSLIISIPILLVLLLKNGASWFMAVVLCISLVPAFLSSLSQALLMIPGKLRQDVAPLQKNTLVSNGGRLALIFSLFLFPWAFVAVLAAGIPRIYANFRLRKLAAPYADISRPVSKPVQSRILRMVKRLMPGAVYYCVSGQLTVWLLSIFGTTTNVAQIGALARLSTFLTVISYLFGSLIYPRFARLPRNSPLIRRRYFQVLGLILAICAALIVSVWLLSNPILWILGPQYSGLNYELVLSITGSSLGIISGAGFSMSTGRGWAINPLLSLPISIASVITGIFLFKVSSLIGVLYYNIFVAAVQCLISHTYLIYKIMKHRRKESLNQPIP